MNIEPHYRYHDERFWNWVIALIIGLFLASVTGILAATSYISVMSGETLKSSDMRQVREFARVCINGGDSYKIRTVWTETEPRKPILFVITCHR